MKCVLFLFAVFVVVLVGAAHGAEKAEDLKIPDGLQNHPAFGQSIHKLMETITQDLFSTDLTTNINGTCDSDIHLLWNAQVSASIMATPTIADLFSDGRKEILVPTATHYLEALDGLTGEDVHGYPFTHPQFSSLASPVEVDVNHDGTGEWMFSTYDGHLIFVDSDGSAKAGWTVKLPKLAVKRDWHKLSGLSDFVEQEMEQFKMHDELIAKRRRQFSREDPKHFDVTGEKHNKNPSMLKHDPTVHFDHEGEQEKKEETAHHGDEHKTAGRQVYENLYGNGQEQQKQPQHDREEQVRHEVEELQRRQKEMHQREQQQPLQQQQQQQQPQYQQQQQPQYQQQQQPQYQQQQQPQYQQQQQPQYQQQQQPQYQQQQQPQYQQQQQPQYQQQQQPQYQQQQQPQYQPNTGRRLQQYHHDLPQNMPPAPDAAPGFEDYYGLEDGMLDSEGMYYDEDEYEMHNAAAETEIGTDGWLSKEAKASMDLIYHPELYEAAQNTAVEDDLFLPGKGYQAPTPADDAHILLDAHILATPVVLDVDLDGGLDAVIPVSYYYDLEYYAKRENADQLPAGVDPMKYAAAAIVVMDLEKRTVKWQRQVGELTHRKGKHAGFAMSSPVVVNGDHDGLVDIYMTTASGSIVGYDAKGNVKKGYPINIGPAHGGCGIQDVNADGKLDICAGDVQGVMSCFNLLDASVLWEHNTDHGAITEAPTFGDVNGDGFLDVVFGTSKGGMWALDGRSGNPLPSFPMVAQGAIMAPILLVNLNNTNPPNAPSVGLGLHLVVVAQDGIMYVASGRSGCVQMMDIGEESYTMVLADDISGNGKIDLVASTVSGSVFVFETSTPFTPLKAWTSRVKSFNGYTAAEGNLGVSIEPESRKSRDVRGDYFRIMFTIKDDRHGKHKVYHPRYYVTITIGKRLLVMSKLYFDARTYSELIATPLERVYGPVIVTVRTEDLLIVEDRVSLSFNMHFLETIKHVFVVPFLLTCLALIFVRKKHEIKPVELRRGVYRGREFMYYN